MKLFVFVLLLVFLTLAQQQKNLTIHLVSHSHNDAGWLMTFDEYYEKQTKHILTNVMNVLIQDPNKKFNWSDLAFFSKWWNEQTQEMKDSVKKLVEEERLVFVGGGWVMNDEALPAYKETMLNMRLGLDFLRDTFNVRPNIGWQIDPFGSSAVTVALFHKLGYDGLVENRISKNFKNKLSNEDGFNFYWEGHQVSKDKSEASLFTHILQRHYNLPDAWSESQVLYKNMAIYKTSVFRTEVDPTVAAIDNLSNKEAKEYHTMLTTGDDFFFLNADRLFQQYDKLMTELDKEGASKGYNTTAKHSTVKEYFSGLQSMQLTYGLFKGDFLPFQEPFTGWDDFWTGYYSSRLHMKRMIRHVFNDIQSTKTLLAIRAIRKNNNSIRFDQSSGENIDLIQHHITKAERIWAILLHHDAITGTHTIHTEPDYYKMLAESLSHLSEAKELIDEHLVTPISPDKTSGFKRITSSMTRPNITQYTIVNPAGYYRIQILNITLPEITEDESYVLVRQEGENFNVITDSYYADLIEIHPDTKRPRNVRKAFFTQPMQALSDVQVYLLVTKNPEDCNIPGIVCAKQVQGKKVEGEQTLQNSAIKVNFCSKGDIQKYEFFGAGASEEFEETYTYYETNSRTRSGLYVFNPRHEKQQIMFSTLEMYEYDIGNLVKILQVYKRTSNDYLLKTYIVNKSGCPNLMKQLFMELQFFTSRVVEVSMNLVKKNKTETSEYKAYVDDSMKLVERPTFNTTVNINRTNDFELNGYFTSACVHGGMLREIYKDQNNSPRESFFGWANSNAIGCTFAAQNEVDIMIFRNIGNNDHKGVNDFLRDNNIVSTSFQFYIDKSVDGVLFHKVRANTKLNEPYGMFSKQISVLNIDNLSASSTLISDWLKFTKSRSQISNEFGEVDIADIKIMRHIILERYNEHELVMVVRNRYNGYVDLSRSSSTGEGIFKNEFIDIIKPKPDGTFRNKCDPKKKVLDEERYELQNLESRVHKSSSKPSNFHGLEPYEMAEFRIVPSATFEALDIKKKEMHKGIDAGGRRLYCTKELFWDKLPQGGQALGILIVVFLIICLIIGIGLAICIKKCTKKKEYKRQINVPV